MISSKHPNHTSLCQHFVNIYMYKYILNIYMFPPLHFLFHFSLFCHMMIKVDLMCWCADIKERLRYQYYSALSLLQVQIYNTTHEWSHGYTMHLFTIINGPRVKGHNVLSRSCKCNRWELVRYEFPHTIFQSIINKCFWLMLLIHVAFTMHWIVRYKT